MMQFSFFMDIDHLFPTRGDLKLVAAGTDKGRERHYFFVGKGELNVPSRVLFSLKPPCRYKNSNSKAHEQTNRYDVCRITWFVAAFLTYTAFHLRLFFTLVHTRLIYW